LKRLAAALAITTLTLLVTTAIAFAAGGRTIAAAPTVTFGVKNLGNTLEGARIGNSYDQYWKLDLLAGDHLTVKFANGAAGRGVGALYLFEAGTDDYSLEKADHVGVSMNANGFAQLDFDAPTSGVYPAQFDVPYQSAGAYDFTATVRHQARLRIKAARVARSGSLAIEARYPDGSKVAAGLGATLYGFWSQKWHRLGASEAANGVIRIRYRLPAALRGQTLKLRASAGGPSFKGVRVTRLVTVG
jgi:hypothetical protein